MCHDSEPLAEPADATTDAEAEVEALRAERDLYRQLLDLGQQVELEPFVQQALALATQVAGARCGYIELGRDGGDEGAFAVVHDHPSAYVAAYREAISRGVIQRALVEGQTIITASALADPRFAERGSVQRNRIEAVLCAPVGVPALGVIYLQGREHGCFTEDDRKRVERFARHLAPLADRVLMHRQAAQRTDATLALRRTLSADDVVGRSEALAYVLEQVVLAAPHKLSVLLTGPTGTGKTQIASVIHRNGPRAAGPFVQINCAALPETLLESELFGAVPGAHSTATRHHEGKVEAAHGGTLLLDEISELSLSAQAKLLQLLQSSEYYPLGSARPMKAEVRIIAATNTDLTEAVQRGAFRNDLLFRLNVLTIRMPSLAERTADVPLLAAHHCRRLAQQNDLPLLRLSTAALDAVETAEWPGNVRQLANTVHSALLRAVREDASQVEVHHLFPDQVRGASAPRPQTYQQQMRELKRRLIDRTLEQCDWNISEASRRLELSRPYLHNLIQSLDLRRDGGAGPPSSSRRGR